MATLTIDRLATPTILGTVELPDTVITVQEIYDQVRTYEAQLANMDLGEVGAFGNGLIEASGKFDLGGGLFSIIQARLLGDLRIRFADQPGPATIPVRVTAGDIVGVVGSANEEPVLNSTFTYMTRALATTGAIIQDSSLYGGKTFDQVMEILLSMAQGRMVESATDVFDFYAQDDVTILFTLTWASSERNRS